jgi:predicted metal-binding membrane protein
VTTTVARRPAAHHPQWWVVGGSALAWLGLAVIPGHHTMSLAAWSLMCVAMMTPLTLPALRHLFTNTIRVRRRRATVLFLLAYHGMWIGLGALGLAAAAVLELHMLAPQWIAVVLLSVAAVWQLTRVKSQALRACRKAVSLPPQGRKADVACLRFGAQQGWRCAVSTWPLMALMALVPVHWPVMAIVAAWMYAEESTRLGRESVRQAAAIFAVAAIAVAALGGSAGM